MKFDEQKIFDQQSEASGRQSGVKLLAPPPSEDGELLTQVGKVPNIDQGSN